MKLIDKLKDIFTNNSKEEENLKKILDKGLSRVDKELNKEPTYDEYNEYDDNYEEAEAHYIDQLYCDKELFTESKNLIEEKGIKNIDELKSIIKKELNKDKEEFNSLALSDPNLDAEKKEFYELNEILEGLYYSVPTSSIIYSEIENLRDNMKEWKDKIPKKSIAEIQHIVDISFTEINNYGDLSKIDSLGRDLEYYKNFLNSFDENTKNSNKLNEIIKDIEKLSPVVDKKFEEIYIAMGYSIPTSKEFSGQIKGIEFKSEEVFNSTNLILSNIEQKFGEIYKESFIKDLSIVLETQSKRKEFHSWEDLETGFISKINKADKFNTLNFDFYGIDLTLGMFNTQIQDGIYTKENIKSINIKNSLENKKENQQKKRNIKIPKKKKRKETVNEK
ncbi:MAG: hypothetical protein KGV57_04665 [Fusobacterium sp.]|nr:hypothetical protein [Fusobacterium sp.]